MVRHLCIAQFSLVIKPVDLPCYTFLRELGRQRTSVELDTTSVKPDQLQVLEEVVNEKIRAHVPVTVQLVAIDDPAMEQVHISVFC